MGPCALSLRGVLGLSCVGAAGAVTPQRWGGKGRAGSVLGRDGVLAWVSPAGGSAG